MRTDTLLAAQSAPTRSLSSLADRILPAATTAATVGCGVVAGVLFIFSVCIMPTLRQRPSAEGIATMQSINVTIVNPLFMLFFMGATVLCAVVVGGSLVSHADGRWLRIAGGLLFVVGVFVLTGAVNIPMNNELAAVAPHSAHGASVWQHYLTAWTAWNHVRTVAAIGSTSLLALAARLS